MSAIAQGWVSSGRTVVIFAGVGCAVATSLYCLLSDQLGIFGLFLWGCAIAIVSGVYSVILPTYRARLFGLPVVMVAFPYLTSMGHTKFDPVYFIVSALTMMVLVAASLKKQAEEPKMQRLYERLFLKPDARE